MLFAFFCANALSTVVYKFSEARAFNDKYDFLKAPIPALIDDILKTPVRIFIGLGVGVWTILVASHLIFVPHLRNSKYAPRAAIIFFELVTMFAWFCATIALALFAADIEPICYFADDIPVLKKIIENCLIVKIGTVFAALSWFVVIYSPLLDDLNVDEAND